MFDASTCVGCDCSLISSHPTHAGSSPKSSRTHTYGFPELTPSHIKNQKLGAYGFDCSRWFQTGEISQTLATECIQCLGDGILADEPCNLDMCSTCPINRTRREFTYRLRCDQPSRRQGLELDAFGFVSDVRFGDCSLVEDTMLDCLQELGVCVHA